MPQVGDLLQGFLFRKQEYEREEEAEEQKKRQKLEDQLSELKFTGLQREMTRNVEEFRYQQRKRGELDEALENLRLRGIDVDALLTGYEAPESPEPPYKWMGTPYEEAGARKEFYTTPQRQYGVSPSGMQWIIDEKTGKRRLVPKPETREGEGESVLDITRAMKTLYPTSESFQEFGEPLTLPDSLWKGLITEPRTPAEEPFFGGKKRLESVLLDPLDPTEQKKGQIDQWLDAGYSKEEIKATIDADKARLIEDEINIQELYDHLGL